MSGPARHAAITGLLAVLGAAVVVLAVHQGRLAAQLNPQPEPPG